MARVTPPDDGRDSQSSAVWIGSHTLIRTKDPIGLDVPELDRLDKLALLAEQEYNLGDRGNWFGEFRGGLHGFYNRLYGVEKHYLDLFSWSLEPRNLPTYLEYEVTSLFFQMTSALECLIYALNALGYGIWPADFRDITSDQELRRISSNDVVGGLVPGYHTHLPSFCELWQRETDIIRTVVDHHAVQKHRRGTVTGGSGNMRPPPHIAEIFKRFGCSPGHGESPFQEIRLRPEPRIQNPALPATTAVDVESLVTDFGNLVKSSSPLIFGDLEPRIRTLLTHQEFVSPRGK